MTCNKRMCNVFLMLIVQKGTKLKMRSLDDNSFYKISSSRDPFEDTKPCKVAPKSTIHITNNMVFSFLIIKLFLKKLFVCFLFL